MVDAACRIAGKEEVYIFAGRHYGRVRFNKGGPEHGLAAGPTLLSKGWNTLPKMGFGTVDTIVPVPGQEKQLYVFYGGRYAEIKLENYDDSFVNNGASLITSGWKSLAQAGFDTVDAAMLTPGTKNEMYFFRGLHYVRLDNSTDKIVNKVAPIAEGWPSLVQAGFDRVDAIVASPSTQDHYYVFRGDQFAVIKVDSSRRDTLVSPRRQSARHGRLWKDGFSRIINETRGDPVEGKVKSRVPRLRLFQVTCVSFWALIFIVNVKIVEIMLGQMP